MLFSALGMLTAIWLLMAPYLGLETGVRADLSVVVGAAALLLAASTTWFRWAGGALAALGFVLGFANFGLSAPLPALASVATCAVALTAAGMAPRPVLVAPAAAVEAPVVLRARAAPARRARHPMAA